MTSRRTPVSSKWALLLFLVPLLVTFGTYSDSTLAPLGWFGALLVLLVVLVVVARSSRERTTGRQGSGP